MTQRYSIVGDNHLGTTALVRALRPGVAVTLVREPGNEFDPNAVMVWVDGRHVGYVPRSQNKTLAAFIDARGQNWSAPAKPGAPGDAPIAADAATVFRKAIPATFALSPNSAFPQVVVE